MKYLYLFLLCGVVCSCVKKSHETADSTIARNDSLINVLMSTDKKWSDLAAVSGFYKTRLDFIADNSIVMRDGGMPLVGRQEINDFTSTHSDTGFSISWQPLRAEIAASGDLGFTYGGWTMKTKTKDGADTLIYGNYVTVWQEQADGSWKFLIDGGNNTPKPVK